MQKNRRLQYLLEAARLKKTTPDELDELLGYLRSEDPVQITELLNVFHSRGLSYTGAENYDREYWQTILHEVLSQDIIKPVEGEKNIPPVRRIPSPAITWFRFRWAGVAAAIIILLGTGAYLWNIMHKKESNFAETSSHTHSTQEVQPGGNKAILTLADGTTIILDSASNGTIALQGNSEIIKKDGQVIYGNREDGSSYLPPPGKESDPSYPPLAGVSRSDGGGPSYNTMTTPRGGQYQITLPDGTRVWLNAASSLRYPTIFSGKERRVEITGEAYFEVMKNAKMPFRVRVNDKAEIEVLGTHFNVNAYENESSINTTLLEGRVRVKEKTNNSSVVLKPGQQASLSYISHQSHNISVHTVDIDKVLAWRNGLFNFEGATLEEVMRQLERWYDIEVVYANGVPNIEFGGKITKGVSLNGLLVLLERADVHFRLEGRRLIVLP